MGVYRKYSGYDDGSGARWRHRRPNGWPIDSKAPDGFTVNGYRKVDRKRRIRFCGMYWTHERYEPGMVVYVGLCDPYGCQIETVMIDGRWNPDNLAADWGAFIEHSHDFAHSGVRPENVGDWNKRPVTA